MPAKQTVGQTDGDCVGLGMRVIPEDRVGSIADSLREHGFAVDVRERSVEHAPASQTTVAEIECLRNNNRVLFGIERDKQFPGYRIYIPNISSWWPSRNRELAELQADVTAVLEQCGAYCPFDD